jgi:hypothetical protein
MREQNLLALLQKKRGFFEAILDLTTSEQEADISSWLSILEQKKVLLSCIDEIDAEISAFKDSFHTLSQELTEELEETRRVIERLLLCDQKSQERRRDELINRN